jgi:hypothetical protein
MEQKLNSIPPDGIAAQKQYDRMMQFINNPEPIRKPPYSCPMSAYGKSKDCQFPNCTCEWRL